MGLKLLVEEAKTIVLSESFNGVLEEHHILLYMKDGVKLGEKFEAVGKTPEEALRERYSDTSGMISNPVINRIYIADKFSDKEKDYDEGCRRSIGDFYRKKKISFDALYKGKQILGENSEALIDFDINNSEQIEELDKVVKQYFGKGEYFNTKKPFVPRWGQEEIIRRCVVTLREYGKVLVAVYTAGGKTYISIVSANQLLPNGGIVLVISPRTDTIDNFRNAIDGEYFFGVNRNQKYSYVTSDNINIDALKRRASEGEVVYITMTNQDLTYADIEERYPQLEGNLDLKIVDEGHTHAVGEKTSQRLTSLEEVPTITLTATPHKIIDNYPEECIIDRSLIWALENREHTKIPQVLIQGISTDFSKVNPALGSLYTIEEGYNPTKLRDMKNGRLTHLSEWFNTDCLFYRDPRSKEKNQLSIVNDTDLSNSDVGMWVLPDGTAEYPAEVYIEKLAEELNKEQSSRIYISSYTIDKERVNGQGVSEYLKIKYGDGEDINKRITILTCGKYIFGTDIPELGHLVLFCKMSQPDSLEQLLGRLTRPYKDKDRVKLYSLCPDTEVKLTYGQMIHNSSRLSGAKEVDVKKFDVIPVNGYDLEGKVKRFSAEEILFDLQGHWQSITRNKVPASAFARSFAKFNKEFWDGLKLDGYKAGKGSTTYGFGRKDKGCRLTEDNGSKVSERIGDKEEQSSERRSSKEERFESLIQDVMIDANWYSFTTKNYNLIDVLKSDKIREIYPQHIDNVLNAVDINEYLLDALQRHLKDKKRAYQGLDLVEIYDKIFVNAKNKQDIGLVHTPYELAQDLVKGLDKLYNEGKKDFLVLNALGGSIPLALKMRYPDSNIVCAEYHSFFKDHLKSLGFKVVDIQQDKRTLTLSETMKFNVVITNPPFNNPKNKSKKGKNGNNILYIPFIKLGKSVLKSGGIMKYINPPSALTKSTVLNQPSPTLSDLMRDGSVENIDFTTKSYFPLIGSPICSWTYVDGKKQGKVTIKHPTEDVNGEYDIKDVYYFPHSLKKIEYDLYRKIADNQDGEPLEVIRNDKKRVLDGTLHTFGYPKVQLGGEGRINFHKKDYPFLSSKLALWLFDYLRRIDGQLSQRQLNGIKIPPNGFKLSEEELSFIENVNCKNFSGKDEEQA